MSVYNFIFSWRANIDTRDVGLSNSVARPIKLRCCVFKNVFVVHHWRATLKCSYKWVTIGNTCICIGPKLRHVSPFNWYHSEFPSSTENLPFWPWLLLAILRAAGLSVENLGHNAAYWVYVLYIIVLNINKLISQCNQTMVYFASAQDERIHEDGCARCVRWDAIHCESQEHLWSDYPRLHGRS